MIRWQLLLAPALALFEPAHPPPKHEHVELVPPPPCGESPGLATPIDLTVRRRSLHDTPWGPLDTLAPVVERGRPIGLELLTSPHSLVERFGLEGGDILVDVDGQKLDDAEEAGSVWRRTEERWRSEGPSRLRMLVRRRGCYVDLKLNVLPPSACSDSRESPRTIHRAVHAPLDAAAALGRAPRFIPGRDGDVVTGIKLFDVDPGSLYAEAGLETGDIVTCIDHQPVDDVGRALQVLAKIVGEWKPDDPNEIDLLVQRGDGFVELKITVLPAPTCAHPTSTIYRTMRAPSSVHGVEWRARIVPVFEDERPIGFQVSGFRLDSPYDRAGLEHGDVVLCIDGLPVPNEDQALAVYAHLDKKWRDDAPNHFDVLLGRDDRFVELKLTILPE